MAEAVEEVEIEAAVVVEEDNIKSGIMKKPVPLPSFSGKPSETGVLVKYSSNVTAKKDEI